MNNLETGIIRHKIRKEDKRSTKKKKQQQQKTKQKNKTKRKDGLRQQKTLYY
jgi:hypothetical protein